jgi:hypothetical protein
MACDGEGSRASHGINRGTTARKPYVSMSYRLTDCKTFGIGHGVRDGRRKPPRSWHGAQKSSATEQKLTAAYSGCRSPKLEFHAEDGGKGIP